MATVPDGVTVEATDTMAATLAAQADVFWAEDPTNADQVYVFERA